MDVNCHSVSTSADQATPNNCEVDPRSTQELEEEIAELCAHMDAATYRLLRAIAEIDRRLEWGPGFLSTAHWLCWRVGIDLVTAREKVRVARALESLPRISESFRQGKVSYSKVRAMTRVATAKNEEYLLYISENGTASHVERVVRATRRACRGEDLEEVRRQREGRYLEMYTDDDGMVVIRGRLPQEVAAVLEKALEAAMDALDEEKKKEARDRDGDDRPVTNHEPAESRWGCRLVYLHDSAESSGDDLSTCLHDSAEACKGSCSIELCDSAASFGDCASTTGHGRTFRARTCGSTGSIKPPGNPPERSCQSSTTWRRAASISGRPSTTAPGRTRITSSKLTTKARTGRSPPTPITIP